MQFGSSLEFIKDGSSGKVKNLSVEETSILKDLDNIHLVREWIDLQLIQKLGLRVTNLHSGEHNLLWGNDFNLSLDNLSLDLEDLEIRSLLWIKTGGSSWDCDITWGNHTWSSWGWSNLIVENSLDLSEVTVGEDQVDVTLEEIANLINLGSVLWLVGVLSEVVVNIIWLWLSLGVNKSGLHQGVLSHNHDGTKIGRAHV